MNAVLNSRLDMAPAFLLRLIFIGFVLVEVGRLGLPGSLLLCEIMFKKNYVLRTRKDCGP